MTRREHSFTPTKLSAGQVELDTEEQELSCRNSIRLGNKETKLMKYFMLNKGKELSTELIFAHVWNDEPEIGDDVVWIYISYLRKKLASINADIAIEGAKDGEFQLVKKRMG
jgi:DNA-binding response OmpR family regulator